MLRAIILLLPLAIGAPVNAQTITIGTAVAVPQVLEHDGMGNVTGLEGDLLAAICTRAGWTCTWEVMDFDTLFPALEAGRIDIAANFLGHTPTRAERVHMTCPYFPDEGQLDGGSYFVTDPAHDPLSGAIAVLAGTLHAERLEDAGLTAQLYLTEDAAIEALLTGEVPAYFGASQTAVIHPEAERLIAAGVNPNASIGIALAVTPTRPFVAEVVDASLANLSREGMISELLSRWLNHRIDDPIALCDTAPAIS
jgi:ABC-type amino acid transport substrate-binding protein